MLVLQVALAVLVAYTVRRTTPIEGDAGWWARSFAHTAGWLMETGREADIQFTLKMVEQRAVALPDPDEEGAGVTRFYLSTSDNWIDRLVAVTVLDDSGARVAATGTGKAQNRYKATWDELVALALSGEVNPLTNSVAG